MLNTYLRYLQEKKDNVTIEELPDSDIKLLTPMLKRFSSSTKKTTLFKYHDSSFDIWMKQITDVGHIILIAKDNDDIVGMVAGITRKVPVGKIKVVYVDRPYRGTGLAEKLFKQVVEWLKSKDRNVIRVGVMGKNTRAQAFYKKMGFVEDIIQMRNLDSKNIKLGWD